MVSAFLPPMQTHACVCFAMAIGCALWLGFHSTRYELLCAMRRAEKAKMIRSAYPIGDIEARGLLRLIVAYYMYYDLYTYALALRAEP